MNVRISCAVAVVMALLFPLPELSAQEAEVREQSGGSIVARATGTFQVKLTPQEPRSVEAGTPLGRMWLDKVYEGDLSGAAAGEMLTAVTTTQGSAGYVAIEQVAGLLHGRRGTFVLQHHGIMDRGAPRLIVVVVPDSATGELEGLSGTMEIIIEGGRHSYVLAYELPER